MSARTCPAIVLVASCTWSHLAAQEAFDLDTSFHTNIERTYVSSILLLQDGKLILSGEMRESGETESRSLDRYLPNGSRDDSFILDGGGGGRISQWNTQMYVMGGCCGLVRRLNMDGSIDPTFAMGAGGANATFSAGQGGDYHVFPDGRVVITGDHVLNDPDNGVVGNYSFIWFKANGDLDNTRQHHRCNGALFTLQQLPDGKFMTTGGCTLYDDWPTWNIQRLHADGSLDQGFTSFANWGAAFTFHPVGDGRVYAGGRFRIQGMSGNLALVRFMPDGSLDPSFNMPDFDLGELSGSSPGVTQIMPIEANKLLVVGAFQSVNGEPRFGICMLDTTGTLLGDLAGNGCGTWMDFNATKGYLLGVTRTPENDLYIYGSYHGYNDGTTNDTLQRMVSRLHGGDLFTQVQEEAAAPATLPNMHLHPVPAHGQLFLEVPTASSSMQWAIHDGMGRACRSGRLSGSISNIDLSGLIPGLYTMEVYDAAQRFTSRFVLE